MNRKPPKPSAEVPSPTLSTDQNSPGIPNGWSIDVDGQRIGLPREDAWRLMAANGRGVKFVVGEQHAGAFHDINFDLWPELIVVRAVSPEHADNESLKRWTEWTGLPVPGSHEAWKDVGRWIGLPREKIPDDITDEWIKSVLRRELMAKHRRDTQDNQRLQAELDIANKMVEAAMKLSSPVNLIRKPKRKPKKVQQAEKSKEEQRQDDAKRGDEWLRGRNCGQYVTYNDMAVTKDIELWDLKPSLDRDRHNRADVWAAKKKPRRKKAVKTR